MHSTYRSSIISTVNFLSNKRLPLAQKSKCERQHTEHQPFQKEKKMSITEVVFFKSQSKKVSEAVEWEGTQAWKSRHANKKYKVRKAGWQLMLGVWSWVCLRQHNSDTGVTLGREQHPVSAWVNTKASRLHKFLPPVCITSSGF